MTDVDIVIIGAGAAGLAAARQVVGQSCTTLVLEARTRVGGRAWTVAPMRGQPIDLGCGWLHSADQNPLVPLARHLGFAIDQTLPDWDGRLNAAGLAPGEQADWHRARDAFHQRVAVAAAGKDRPADACLESGCRWNPLLDAISTWLNGTTLAHVSCHDFGRYADSGINWRTPQGYGRLIAFLGTALPIRLATPAIRIDWRGKAVKIDTPRGSITARAAIVTAPTAVLAAGAINFLPGLPEATEAALHDLPLGADEKLYFRLGGQPEDFPADHHVMGALDRVATGGYQLRPHGRPMIETFVGGDLASRLAADGPDGFAAFAADELADRLGSDIRSRLTPLASSAWSTDPWSRGSYSHARPGRAGARAILGTPVDDRLFFAGEATHPTLYGTAHGAYLSGEAAARRALRAIGRIPGATDQAAYRAMEP